MARIGSFVAPALAFGIPVGVIKPPDNVVPLYDRALENASDLTEAEKRRLQREADDLAAALILARDYKQPA